MHFSLLNEKHSPLEDAKSRYFLEYLSVNLRVLASALAEMSMEHVIESSPTPDGPLTIGLCSKPCTQKDMESPWCRYWVNRILNQPMLYYRKAWEYRYVSQVLFENGMLEAGKHGLGMGCGEEPLPCFFTSLGVQITAGDQPIEAAQKNPAE